MFHESGEMLKTSVHKNVGKSSDPRLRDLIISLILRYYLSAPIKTCTLTLYVLQGHFCIIFYHKCMSSFLSSVCVILSPVLHT